MEVKILKECGYEEALLGVSLSYNSTVERAKEIAPKLAFGKPGENKFLESMYIWLDVRAPRFWWQEADTYRLTTKQSECHSSDTEVMTNKGWFLFKDVPDDAKYATLNINNKKIEYQESTKKISYYYSGKMIHINNKKVDLLITPNHDLIGKTSINGKIKKYKSQEINKLFIPKCGIFEDGDRKDFFTLAKMESTWDTGYRKCIKEYAEKHLDMKIWLWVLGFYIAEGRSEKNNTNYNTYFYQKENSPYCDILENYISKLGYHASKTFKNKNIRWTITDKQLYEYLHSLGDTYAKHIPEFVFGLDYNLQKILFDGMFAGDGTKKSGIYSTTSKRLADDTQRLLRNIGISSNIFFRKDCRSAVGGIYTINPQNTNWYVINDGCKSETLYEGNVYCVEVPNGTLYTRRNGKAIWSGNSTMHTLTKRPVTQEDLEHPIPWYFLEHLNYMIDNYKRGAVQLDEVKARVPEGFLQRRIWVMNYKVLQNIYIQRKDHRLPQWQYFVNTIIKNIEHPEFIRKVENAKS